MFPRPDFFAGARLNFAENLLFPASTPDPSSTAVITATERPSDTTPMSWASLRDSVRQCANALRAAGLTPGAVVAGFVSNHAQALVAMLGAAAVGAVWSGISPDNGVSAVLDRLVQIRPAVLFADNGALYNGKEWGGVAKTVEVARALKEVGLERVVVVRSLKDHSLGLEELRNLGVEAEDYDVFLSRYVFLTPHVTIVHTSRLTRPAPLTSPSPSSSSPPRTPSTSSTRAGQPASPRP